MKCVTVCKKWNSAIEMSWLNFKYLNVNAESLGMAKKIVSEEERIMHRENFKTIFKSVLKRCGRFLTGLKDKAMFETLKPFFNKVKKFDCQIEEPPAVIFDEDLKGLFSQNRKLECLKIHSDKSINGSCFEEVSCETIREFFFRGSTLFHIVCRVSIN